MSKFEREQKFEYPKILIVGYGIVGKNLKKEFPFAETYDPDKDQKADYKKPPKKLYDIAFIAVPTPNKNFECDISFVEKAISETNSSIYIIKSTVPPGTTEKFSQMYCASNFIFSPEYYGNTQFADPQDKFVILGGKDELAIHRVRQLYEMTKGPNFKFHICNSTEAEIIKYMENCFLAMKVIFCNQFKDIADLYDVSYDNIRDGFILDKRVGESHTRVFDNYRGYDSKCFNKDIPAFLSAIKNKGFNKQFIMDAVENINDAYRS